jgi:hypothetical protein
VADAVSTTVLYCVGPDWQCCDLLRQPVDPAHVEMSPSEYGTRQATDAYGTNRLCMCHPRVDSTGHVRYRHGLVMD